MYNLVLCFFLGGGLRSGYWNVTETSELNSFFGSNSGFKKQEASYKKLNCHNKAFNSSYRTKFSFDLLFFYKIENKFVQIEMKYFANISLTRQYEERIFLEIWVVHPEHTFKLSTVEDMKKITFQLLWNSLTKSSLYHMFKII